MPSRTTAKKGPEKSLIVRIPRTGGRNNSGRITVRHRGGGARKMYRKIDFRQERLGISGKVAAIEYDPNRTAYIALIAYENGSKGYILAPQGLQEGDSVLCAEQTEAKPGNRMKLKHVPVGTVVHNIELVPGKGGKIVRSAGAGATVSAHEDRYSHVVLPSSESRKVLGECFVSVGAVSNQDHRYQDIPTAGRARKMGRRPHVRGSAMNPVDHPHGGGEGRTGIGMKFPKTPWGKRAMGVKTRKKKKWTNTLITKRRKKKKKK